MPVYCEEEGAELLAPADPPRTLGEQDEPQAISVA